MRIYLIYFVTALIIFIPSEIYSQLPNGGFENWTNGVPDSWWTNNNDFGAFFTKTSDSHSGSSAIKGEVLDFAGEPAVPYLDAKEFGNEGFSISQRYANLTGYYQFHPVEDEAIAIWIGLSKNSELIGYNLVTTDVAASTYTSFLAPINYYTEDIPDNIDIVITIWGDSLGNDLPKIGTYFILDDLELSGIATNINDEFQSTPTEYFLYQNYPNPFNPTTIINYSIANSDFVVLDIYDMLGRKAQTLVSEFQTSGIYSVEFDASNLSSGIYFYKLQCGSFTATKSLIILK